MPFSACLGLQGIGYSQKMKHVLIPGSDHFYLSASFYQVERPKAAVQIIHGASEYKGRYDVVARYLQDAGFAVLVSDLRGHGQSTDARFVRGFMPPLDVLVEDQHVITRFLQTACGDVPIVLLAHSFGANIARLYLGKYDGDVLAVVMSGAPFYVRGISLAMTLVRLFSLILSPNGYLFFTSKLTTSASLAWACSDPVVIEERRSDPYRKNFRYQIASILTIFDSVRHLHCWNAYTVANPSLPILFVSGSDDPIPGGRLGLLDSERSLRRIGYTDITSTVFAHMRHEVLLEREKEVVFDLIISCIQRAIARGTQQ